MPAHGDKVPSVHLALLPEANSQWKNDGLAQKWDIILNVRSEATKALEEARAEKRIGHPLDAAVTISAKEDLYNLLQPYAEDLRFIFIVSSVSLLKDKKLEGSFESEKVKGLLIKIEAAPGEKCERCWIHETSVGSDGKHPTICQRCCKALAAMS
jgi:isoleucyl-tRNA synthetase